MYYTDARSSIILDVCISTATAAAAANTVNAGVSLDPPSVDLAMELLYDASSASLNHH